MSAITTSGSSAAHSVTKSPSPWAMALSTIRSHAAAMPASSRFVIRSGS